jgi:NAD-dependent DNA ligase
MMNEDKQRKFRYAIIGTFDDITRSELIEFIKVEGGEVQEQMNRDTDYIVAGSDCYEELTRANRYFSKTILLTAEKMHGQIGLMKY